MGELPAGTVTLLFSDIEGSTAMVGRLGDRYGDALSAHRALLRAEFATWRGQEMSTEGDSFFVVFASAGDAVSCCLAAQQALASYDWPGGEAVRVRMGVHCGQPTRHEGNYIGMDVHRAARIAATAHGGQVVMSAATWERAQPDVPEGLSVRDLGFHRLKDIAEAERICQLTGPGLRTEFPPLKSLGAETNLPVPPTPLVGREDDLRRLREAVSQPGARLVTLTGTGGVGKTRLSIAAASSLAGGFEHGVFFVALAAVTDADVMWKALADSLDLTVEGGAAAAVTSYLSRRQALLVLDNLEQLDGAAQAVDALVNAAPRVVVLATSRGPLRVQGEQEFPVPPLGVDGEAAGVAASAAVRLFVQHAGMVRPGFAATPGNAADIAAICRRLDGLPLAIELAAARVRLLAPRALLARLGQTLGLGTAEAGRPLRQQTLRNLIAWSYDLLAPGTAELFRRMSVFAGGCDLEALAAVAGGGDDLAGPDPLDLVAELQDVSLVRVTEGTDGEPRLAMLETIREYALERLAETGELDETRLRHATYFAEFAERARSQMEGTMLVTALDRVEADHDNLRAALAWSLDPAATEADDAERTSTGLRLATALGYFWYQHGHATEGRKWLERATDLASAGGGAQFVGAAFGLGVLLDQLGHYGEAQEMFERSLAVARELGDRVSESKSLNSLGIVHRHLDEIDTARSMFEEAIALNRELGLDGRLGASLSNLGQLESAMGRYDRAMEVLAEALQIDERSGTPYDVAVDQISLSLLALRAGRPHEALEMLCRAFGFTASSGNTALLVNELELAAVVSASLAAPLRAARLVGAAEGLRQETDMELSPAEADTMEGFLAPARATVSPGEWAAELATGRGMSQPEALALLLSLSSA